MPEAEHASPGWTWSRHAALVFFSGVVLLAALAVLAPHQAAAQVNPPTGPGDWYVDSPTTVASQAVTVTGNVIIANGGSLTLNSVTLRISSSSPGEFALYERQGGTLTVEGGSISAASPSLTYRFELFGVTSINNSVIQDMWGSPTQDKFGIQIYNGNTTITNSSILRGQKGNILIQSGSPVIRDNTIQLAQYVEESNDTSSNCYIYLTYRAYGILAMNGSTPIIERNTVQNNGEASGFFDPYQYFFDTYYPSCTWGYMYIYEYFMGDGIAVRGSSAEISGNVVRLNSQTPTPQYVTRYINGTQVTSVRYAGDLNGNAIAGGISLTGGGRGNVTGNLIDRNYAAGIWGDGSLAFVDSNIISNHTSTSGIIGSAVAVGAGVTVSNSTFRNNYYAVYLVGGGTGIFLNVSFGTPTTTPAVYVDYGAQGLLNFYNVSFVGWTFGISFQSYQGAGVNLFNCTISQSQISFNNWGSGHVSVFWSFQVMVAWPNGASAPFAFAVLTNQSDGVLFADLVGGDGISPYLWIPGITIAIAQNNQQTTTNNPLAIKVYSNGTISPPYEFAFNESMFLVLTIYDPIPPSLNVFSPLSGQGFRTNEVHLVGNAFDVGSGMEVVEVSTDAGATWIPSLEQLPGWSVDVTLLEGPHDLMVRARDRSNTSTTVNITGILVDTVAPDIRILSPALPPTGDLISYTTFTAVFLKGTVVGDAVLTVNGDPLAIQGGSFSKQLILSEGANFFHLLAVDSVGNSDQVDFILISDTIAPAIYVSSPVENYATNRSIITVAGVTETDVALTLNDAPLTTNGGVFSQPYALSEGLNTVRITATDRAGNNNTVTRTVTFDTVAPEIILLSPTADLLTHVKDLDVIGSVEATIPTVFVNGAPVPTSRGVFSKTVRLDEGRNVIVVTAWDSAGNGALYSAVVNLDTVAPFLSITSPNFGTLVSSIDIRVTGQWVGASTVTVNGIAVTDLGSTFDEKVGLAEGENEITVVALDAAGNHAEERITVWRDTIAPTIQTDLPATPVTTNASVITITGHVDGASELRANTKLVALDADGNFTVTLALSLGENKITFQAVDTAGNEATVLGAVQRVSPPLPPQGLFGLGDLQYVLLPLFLAAGAGSAFLVLRRGRRGDSEA